MEKTSITAEKWKEWKSARTGRVFVARENPYGSGRDGTNYLPEIFDTDKFRSMMDHPLVDKTYHEYILPDEPCHPYVDIENKKGTLPPSPEECKEILVNIIKCIQLAF